MLPADRFQTVAEAAQIRQFRARFDERVQDGSAVEDQDQCIDRMQRCFRRRVHAALAVPSGRGGSIAARRTQQSGADQFAAGALIGVGVALQVSGREDTVSFLTKIIFH